MEKEHESTAESQLRNFCQQCRLLFTDHKDLLQHLLLHYNGQIVPERSIARQSTAVVELNLFPDPLKLTLAPPSPPPPPPPAAAPQASSPEFATVTRVNTVNGDVGGQSHVLDLNLLPLRELP